MLLQEHPCSYQELPGCLPFFGGSLRLAQTQGWAGECITMPIAIYSTYMSLIPHVSPIHNVSLFQIEHSCAIRQNLSSLWKPDLSKMIVPKNGFVMFHQKSIAKSIAKPQPKPEIDPSPPGQHEASHRTKAPKGHTQGQAQPAEAEAAHGSPGDWRTGIEIPVHYCNGIQLYIHKNIYIHKSYWFILIHNVYILIFLIALRCVLTQSVRAMYS